MYENYFGFSEPPFGATPDPRFSYSNARFQEAFATLAYGMTERKGIVVITGEPGTGKTTLLKSFARGAGPRLHLSCVLDPRLNFVELLGCALEAVDLAPCPADRVSILERLKPYLLDQLARDHVVALLLDEAQAIDDAVLDELRLLTDWEQGGARLLQLALMGQPDLELKLDRPPLRYLRQRIALRSRLGPLPREEVGPYIDFRLAAAGYRGKAIFQTAAIRRIEFFSRGIPRVINVICDNALLAACATEQLEVGAETIDAIAQDMLLGERSAEGAKNSVPAAGGHEEKSEATPQIERSPTELIERAAPLPLHRGAGAEAGGARREWMESLRPASPWAAVVAAIGGALLFAVYHGAAMKNLLPIAVPVESMRQALAPLPGRIYRVVTEGPLSQNAVKKFTVDHQKSLEWDWSEDDGSAVGQGAPGAKSRKPARPALSFGTDRRVERTSPAPALASRAPSTRREELVVIENSFVRDEPTSGAKIIATLRPGARVEIVRRSGNYFQIRSLDAETLRGYVHREDAFFAPLH